MNGNKLGASIGRSFVVCVWTRNLSSSSFDFLLATRFDARRKRWLGGNMLMRSHPSKRRSHDDFRVTVSVHSKHTSTKAACDTTVSMRYLRWLSPHLNCNRIPRLSFQAATTTYIHTRSLTTMAIPISSPSPKVDRFQQAMESVYGNFSDITDPGNWTPPLKSGGHRGRYLWTDAFGVINFLTMHKEYNIDRKSVV